MSVCALILTAIVCICFMYTAAAKVEQEKAYEKAAEEISKVSDEFNKVLDETNKEMQRSMRQIGKP